MRITKGGLFSSSPVYEHPEFFAGGASSKPPPYGIRFFAAEKERRHVFWEWTRPGFAKGGGGGGVAVQRLRQRQGG